MKIFLYHQYFHIKHCTGTTIFLASNIWAFHSDSEIKMGIKKMNLLFIYRGIIFLGTITFLITSEPVEDKQALLDFLQRVDRSHHLNWNEDTSVCRNWTGVSCNGDQSSVLALRLSGVGISGSIPPDTLSRLSAIQILNLRSNNISGSFPLDFFKLQHLTSLYLHSNEFSGPLPSDFSVWKNLTVLDLSKNHFSGSIPPSISNLTQLIALNLADNSLSGEIPDINVPSLQLVNLANNNFTGTLPQSLKRRFPSFAFSGNNLSSENGLPRALPVHQSSPHPFRDTRKLKPSAILGSVIGSCALCIVIIALLMVCCYSKKHNGDGLLTKSQKKQDSSNKGAIDRQEKDNRLVFFESCNLAFDLEDLLRASAEVLGKGTFGTTYKAALEDATATVAVKRLKEVTVAKKDFEQLMEVVGNIRHGNVCALKAYYYSKEEKLMVHDYYEQGSVSAMLHGKRGEDRMPLDWETRLKIAVGAARGIAFVHTQNGGRLVHGNIKASNIFLNSDGYGCVCDIGLATLMNPMPQPAATRVPAGYRALELGDTRKATHASDVYSYGVLLLELLTGKSPTNATGGGDEVVNLVKWVSYVVREEWTAEVFDVELLRYPNFEEEMVEMLQIGMDCVARIPSQRPKMPDVVKMVENIRRVSSENHSSPDDNLEIAISTPHAPVANTSSVPQ